MRALGIPTQFIPARASPITSSPSSASTVRAWPPRPAPSSPRFAHRREPADAPERRTRHAPCRRLTLLAPFLLACGDDDGSEVGTGDGASDDPTREYEASVTVLESPEHGPQLCGGVMDSYPPQCGGPDIVGWDWDAVDAESANGTTWGEYHVVGTWSDDTFTLTRPATAPEPPGDRDEHDFSPACAEPEVVDATHGQEQWEGVTIPERVALWVSDPAGDWDGPFVLNVVVRPGAGDAARAAIRERYLGALCITERDGPTEAELVETQSDIDHEQIGAVASYPDTTEGVVVVEVWVVDEDTTAYARDRWGDLVELRGILLPVT